MPKLKLKVESALCKYLADELTDEVFKEKIQAILDDAETLSADEIAIGNGAGATSQGLLSVAIGSGAGATNQGGRSSAVGRNAGSANQGARSVAVGEEAGFLNQGDFSVAIGNLAGNNAQPDNSIVISADNLDRTPSAAGEILLYPN